MNNEKLKTLVAELEAELAQLRGRYDPLAKEHAQITERQLNPLLDRQHALQEEMGEIHPRLTELEQQLVQLRAAVALAEKNEQLAAQAATIEAEQKAAEEAAQAASAS
jgi:predicted  nucleic acid-binding Zn-ribbon protein